MPTYCYEDRFGKVHERFFAIEERAPVTIMLEDGRHARRCYQAESAGVPPKRGWPMECIASGVHPEQAGELRREFARCGVLTEVTNDGNPVYRSASHRRRALKCRGFVDRSSYI